MHVLVVSVLSLLAMNARATGLNGPQATIIETGSTNRTRVRVTVDEAGRALVASVAQQAGSPNQEVQVQAELCKQLLDRLKELSSLNGLPARHCMKSVSFGSRLYIEYQGKRSPDLSCPGQNDSRTEALRDLAMKIIENARATGKIPDGRRVEK